MNSGFVRDQGASREFWFDGKILKLKLANQIYPSLIPLFDSKNYYSNRDYSLFLSDIPIVLSFQYYEIVIQVCQQYQNHLEFLEFPLSSLIGLA